MKSINSGKPNDVDIFPYLAAILIGRVHSKWNCIKLQNDMFSEVTDLCFLIQIKGLDWDLCGNRKISRQSATYRKSKSILGYFSTFTCYSQSST
jgi:hypothetical protein